MASNKRELTLDLLARDKTKQATDSAARNVDNFGKAAEKSAGRVEKLNREADLIEKELGDLARAFADTDDAAQRMDLSKTIRRMEADLKRINKQKGILEGLLPDPEPAAKGFVSKLASGIAGSATSLATSAGSAVGPVVGGAIAAAAAPVLVSTLSTALSAGSGLGVLGAGIVAAVKDDKQIQAAGKAAGQQFMTGLSDTAAKSLRGPILQSLGILSAAGDRLNQSLGKTFAELSDDLVPFTRKVVGAGEAIAGSLTRKAAESGPALDGLGDAITLLGDGASNFIDAVVDGGPAAADNIRLIAGATSDLLTMTGNFLGTLNKLSSNPWITGPLLPLLRKHYKDAAEASDDLKGANEAIIPTWETAAKVVDGQRKALVELNKELKSQADPVFALIEAQNKLKDAQEASADAIKEHGANSAEAREATRNLAVAALDLQARVGALGQNFDGKLTPAMYSTLRAAGLTEGQIRDVEREFGAAKQAGDRYAKTYAATARVYGAATARKSLYSVRDAANDIPRAVTIAMKITGVDNVSKAAASIRKQYEARAEGGPVKAGKAYVVGDGGVPEVFVPDRDGTIIPSIEQYARGGGSMGHGWSGRGTMPAAQPVARLELGGDREIVALFRRLIRTHNLLQV